MAAKARPQSSPPPPPPAKKWYQNWWLLLAAVVVGFLVFRYGGGERQQSSVPAVPPAVMQKRWVDMTAAEKESVLMAIIQSNQDPYKTQRQALEAKIMEAFRQQMQFPQTLEFEAAEEEWVKNPGLIGRSRIKDVAEGLLLSDGVYRADNEDGQKVRGTYSFTLKFDGQALTVVDGQVK